MQNRHGTNRFVPQKKDELEYQFAINENITAKMVRIVGDNISNPGIYSTYEALKMAEAMGLDLIEISPTAQPPVCRILDFQKFLYQQKKKQKELKAKTAKVIVKEIRFGPNTDDHDYNFKLKHAINFLQEGAKVKAFVFFKGRSIVYTEQGKEILDRFIHDLEEYGKLEMEPKLEGKRMIIMLTPISGKRKTNVKLNNEE